ncbi:MAG TPA: hypothetical protein VFE57_05975 [Cyclobacteriaceae bacterium]|nr:hypothetical protein [Cyclobacteriaceae bacterium]
MRSIILTVLLSLACNSVFAQDLPTNPEKEDLGVGTIVLKDHSIIKNITIHEIKDYWIVYVKNESLHDLMMEKIERIEFPKSEWGNVKIEFRDHKPTLMFLNHPTN